MAENKEKHLCKLAKKDYLKSNLQEYSELVKNPKFVCAKCGRAAEQEKYLCKPAKLV